MKESQLLMNMNNYDGEDEIEERLRPLSPSSPSLSLSLFSSLYFLSISPLSPLSLLSLPIISCGLGLRGPLRARTSFASYLVVFSALSCTCWCLWKWQQTLHCSGIEQVMSLTCSRVSDTYTQVGHLNNSFFQKSSNFSIYQLKIKAMRCLRTEIWPFKIGISLQAECRSPAASKSTFSELYLY